MLGDALVQMVLYHSRAISHELLSSIIGGIEGHKTKINVTCQPSHLHSFKVNVDDSHRNNGSSTCGVLIRILQVLSKKVFSATWVLVVQWWQNFRVCYMV